MIEIEDISFVLDELNNKPEKIRIEYKDCDTQLRGKISLMAPNFDDISAELIAEYSSLVVDQIRENMKSLLFSEDLARTQRK
jgi:hypothetical protein